MNRKTHYCALYFVTIPLFLLSWLGANPAQAQNFEIEYSTFLGGRSDDRAHGMTVSASGVVYLTAPINSTDFPTTQNAVQKRCTGVYAAAMNSSGDSLLFSTYIGIPGGANYAHGIAVDKDGYIYIAGNTTNSNFPTTDGAFDGTYNGSPSQSHGDAFVIKLSPDGSEIVYSTFIGGSGMDLAGSIAVDDAGNAYLVGTTGSEDFPVTANAFDSTFNGGEGNGREDSFVAKIAPNGGELVYCTYLGGSVTDIGSLQFVDKDGCVFVSGVTSSPDFPTTDGAYSPNYNGGSGFHGQGDGFVSKLSADGSRLEYSTYIGGSDDDGADSVAVDRQGYLYISGGTKSTEFPTTEDALNRIHQGEQDAYIMMLSPDYKRLLYSTLFGGSKNESAKIAIADSGLLFISGSTESTDFSINQGDEIAGHHGASDLFVAAFDPTVKKAICSAFLGGSEYESGNIRIIGDDIYLAGNTNSRDYPTTTNAFDTTYNGGNQTFGGDAFITKLRFNHTSCIHWMQPK